MTTPFNSTWKKIVLAVAGVPGFCLALSNGPGMPEYNDFESVENTDLVNLSTGDFAYSIPVMTVPGPGLGYPLVLNYHAGILPEQEASWVGLGWNLQSGAVTRQVNNFPDDFKKTLIEERMKSVHIHGWMASVTWNGATVGISWDSENGLGGMVGYALTIPNTPIGIGATAGVNGVYEGVGVTLSTGVGGAFKNITASAGISVGIHSKHGTTAGLGVSIGAKDKAEAMGGAHTSASLASAGVSLSSRGGMSAGASAGVGASASTSVKGSVTQTSSNFFVPMWTPWTGYVSVSWGTWDMYIDGLQEDHYYGFLYSDSLAMECRTGSGAARMASSCYWSAESYLAACRVSNTCPNDPTTLKRAKKMDYNDAGGFSKVPGGGAHDWLKLGSTGEDIYSVQTQGMSGTFRPFRAEDGDYYTYLSNQDYTRQTNCQGFMGSWFGKKCARNATLNYGLALEGDTTVPSGTMAGYYPPRNRHRTSYSGVSALVWRFNDETGGALYTDPGTRDAGPTVAAASRKIEPQFDASGRINGWIMTSPDGVRYLYLDAQYNYVQQNLSASDANLSDWTRRETPYYAYAWLLSAILSPDHVYMGSCTAANCRPTNADIGGWVLFGYTAPQVVAWKTPTGSLSEASAFSMDEKASGSPVNPKVTSYVSASGLKTIGYLQFVETPTHKALFELEERSDNIPPQMDSIGFAAGFSASSAVDHRTCPHESNAPTLGPHALPLYPTNVLIPTSSFAPGTKVSIITRRMDGWSKYVLFKGRRCRTGYRDELAKVDSLATSTHSISGGNWVVPIGNSTLIQHVRVVIGELQDVPGAVSTHSYLTGITLVNKNFNREVSSVKFTYDYSLGQGTPNSESSVDDGEGGNQGRLTLKAVTMGAGKNGPWNPPYQFFYGGTNKNYNADKKDYWGYSCDGCSLARRRPDGTADLWNLQKILSPSGSEINVAYEAKRVDFNEGIPTVMNGSDVGQYLGVSTGNIVGTEPGGAGSGTVTYTGPYFNADSIASEISSTFAGKYVVYLGSFDIPKDKTANLSALPTLANLFPGVSSGALATARYLVEGPSLTVTGGMYDGGCVEWDSGDNCIDWQDLYDVVQKGITTVTVNGGTTSDIPSSRKSCSAPVTCSFTVGRILSGNSNVQIRVANSEQTTIRVWAYIPTTGLSAPPHIAYGGGVRVSQLSFRDPFTGATNSVNYEYRDASTPTLPDPMSNYYLGLRYPQAAGERYYIGNPAILHGKVIARHQAGPTLQYSTEYEFITSRDVPVRIEKYKVGRDFRVKILDRSGLWGSLWRKTDKNASGAIVRSELSTWASRINSAWRSALNVPGGANLNVTKDGQNVFVADDPKFKVWALNSTDSSYFGVTQKLFSGRFVPYRCEEVVESTADKNTCIKTDTVRSVQVEHVRFAPMSRKRTTTQDGVAKMTESNLFDYLTGIPLLDVQTNRRPDQPDEYIVTLKSLAQHHGAYAAMKGRNMLTQEFSSTLFQFDANPEDKNFRNLSSADLRRVVSSEFTLWEEMSGIGIQYRKSETFKLRDTTGYAFALPTPSTATGTHWRSMGKNIEYDFFGHVVDFQNSLGVRSAQIYGYGQSYPTAYAQNARRDQIHYESFELSEGLPAGQIAAVSGTRSYTGANSVRIRNCLEKKRHPASGLVSKPDCGGGSSTMVGFPLRDLPLNVTYVASVWYYDEFQGSNPDNIADSTLLKDSTQVTRPGLYIGNGAACAAATFPNGVYHNPTAEAPAANGAWNADQRATGSKKWKRLWVEFTPTPGSACGSGPLYGASVYLYASKGKPGSDVYYDELRVRPKSALMTTYAYDHRGNMISSADANEIPRHFEYDAFGNLTGMRNHQGALVSEQAKKFGDRRLQVSFKAQPPSQDTLCQPPVFVFNGQQITEEYTLLQSNRTDIAWIKDSKVCTQDKGGTAQIQIQTGNGIITTPVKVEGEQLGMIAGYCDYPTSQSQQNRCIFDIAALKTRLSARGHGTGSVWVADIQSRGARSWYQIGCFDGNATDAFYGGVNLTGDAYSSQVSVNCTAGARLDAMHYRFNQFYANNNPAAIPLTAQVGPTTLPLPYGVSAADRLSVRAVSGGTVMFGLLRQTNTFKSNDILEPAPASFSVLKSNFQSGYLGIRKRVSFTPTELAAMEAASGSGKIGIQLIHFDYNGSLKPGCITRGRCDGVTATGSTLTYIKLYVY